MHPVPRGIPILEPTGAVTAEINRSRDYLQQCLTRLAKDPLAAKRSRNQANGKGSKPMSNEDPIAKQASLVITTN